MFHFGWQPTFVMTLPLSDIAMLHRRGIEFIKRRPPRR